MLITPSQNKALSISIVDDDVALVIFVVRARVQIFRATPKMTSPASVRPRPYCAEYVFAHRDLVKPGSILALQTRKRSRFFFVIVSDRRVCKCLSLEAASADEQDVHAYSVWSICNAAEHLKLKQQESDHVLPFLTVFLADDQTNVFYSGSLPLTVCTSMWDKVAVLPSAEDVSKFDLKECVLCEREDDECGVLSHCFETNWEHSSWAHEYCLTYSDRTKPHQTDAQMVDYWLSHSLNCVFCGGDTATLSCREKGCRNVYHFPCARLANTEWVELDKSIYCTEHVKLAVDKQIDRCRFPRHTNVEYLPKNDFSGIQPADLAAIADMKDEWSVHDPVWFNQMLSSAVRVRAITDPTHWAYCKRMASNNQPQYECFIAHDVAAGEMICEYTGVVRYGGDDVDSEEGNFYIAEMTLPDAMQLPRPDLRFVVDARYKGNEARFINSVSPTTPDTVQVNCSMETIWARGSLRIVVNAKRDLRSGETLVLDYGHEYFFQ